MFICSSFSFFAWYAQQPMALRIHSLSSTEAEDKNTDKLRACCFQDKNADKLRSLQEPSGRRLANFVWPQANLPRTSKNKPAHCCTPITNGKKSF
jgi:hypothetical protein